MKKTAILIAMMLVVISVSFGTTGCNNGNGSEATEPSATPIATVAPTAAPTQAPTSPTSATDSTGPTQAPTQAATFKANIATSAISSTLPSETATDENGEPITEPADTEKPTASPNSSGSLGEPDANGNYVLTGTVTGHGGSTVVIMLGDGNEYEFDYSNTGLTYDDIADGSTITVTSDGDPSGAGVPNAVSIS